MKKKSITLLTASVLSVSGLLMVGCGSKPSPEPTPTVKHKVTVLGGEGSVEVDPGTEVTVKAYEEADDPFINWTVDGQEVSKTAEYKFVVNQDVTITANYTFGQYVKNVTKDSDNDFKILNLTDIQLHDGESTDVTFRVLDELITREQPNMITFLGDMLNDDKTYASINNVQKVISKIDSYNIPWAPIFGNHDFEDYQTSYTSKKTTTSGQLASWYKACKNCLFLDGPTMSHELNKGNYVVNVIDSTTKKPVESLIFADSRLAGIQDDFLPFYKKAILHSSLYNNKTVVPSVLFTHIALPQYSNAFKNSKNVEYRNMTGICGADPGKLTAGTDKLFPLMKELGSTKMMVVGHDHENAYSTTYDGIKLAFATKSSDGDNSGFASTVFPLGGTIIKLSSGKDEELYNSYANNIFKVTSSQDRAYNSELIGYWKYSDAKLMFDIELPSSGTIIFNLQGTNVLVDGKNESYLGAWNRLSVENIIDAANKTVSGFGKLTQIEGNKYRFSVDLKDVPLNVGSGESARGDETIRLVYFHNATTDFTVSNLNYEFKEVTETDQKDLSNAVIANIPAQTIQKRTKEGATGNIPVRPTPTVTLDGSELKFGEDILFEYENNSNTGTGKLKVVPSPIGLHKYKGVSNSKEFSIKEGSRGVKITNGQYTLDFSPALSKTNTLVIDFKFDEDSQNKKFKFFLGCRVDGKGHWDNYYGYYVLSSNGTIANTKGSTDTGIVSKKLEDGYIRLTIDAASLKTGTDYSKGSPETSTTFDLFYVDPQGSEDCKANGYIDINPTEKKEKTTEFTMKDSKDFVIANFTDIHVDSQDLISDTGTVGKTIKYGITQSNPDILLFSGDIAGAAKDLSYLFNYLDGFKIPYFLIMGNHDHEGSLGYDTIANYADKSQYGYIEKGPEDLTHIGNYTIKIKNSQEQLVHSLIMMNTGNKYTITDYTNVEYVTGTQVTGTKYGEFNGQKTYCNGTSGAGNVWDGIRGNQITWFENTANSLDCDTTLVCHAGFNEYVKAYEIYQDAVNRQDQAAIDACAPIGHCTMAEQVCGSVEKTGLFDAIKRTRTKNVICGHDHNNDFSLLYQGVRLTYALKTGSGAYWEETGNRNGYTELKINSQGQTTLDQKYFNPLS